MQIPERRGLMMRFPLVCTGAVSLGLHLVIIVALLSSGVTPGRKGSSLAVSYVDLRQPWVSEQQQKETDLEVPKQSPLNPQQKTLKTESVPSPPPRSKNLIQKLPAVAAPKLPSEPKQVLSKSIVLAGNSNITPVETAASPAQMKQPRPASLINENGRNEDPLLIKKGAGSSTGSTAYTRGAVFLDALPIVTENSPPAYPRIAKRRGWDGDVLLLVQVNKMGQVLKVQIDRSSGHGVLDQVAIKAVRNWRFHAARFNDQPVNAEVMVPIRFEFQKP
jgi:protein TonB